MRTQTNSSSESESNRQKHQCGDLLVNDWDAFIDDKVADFLPDALAEKILEKLVDQLVNQCAILSDHLVAHIIDLN